MATPDGRILNGFHPGWTATVVVVASGRGTGRGVDVANRETGCAFAGEEDCAAPQVAASRHNETRAP
jgi:hypothetical protein